MTLTNHGAPIPAEPAAPAVERATAPETPTARCEKHDEATLLRVAAQYVRQAMGQMRHRRARHSAADAQHLLESLAVELPSLRATLAAQAERERALIEVVQDYALVERHTETRAHGSQDLYRMPFRGSSWFDSREAAVADWLSARAGRPAPEEP